MTETVKVQAEMSEGEAPESVRLEVTQGPHTLRSADVDPANPVATFEMDDGDYVAKATSLVPREAPAETIFAVPTRVKVNEERVVAAARAVVAHWAEFGPDHGLDEVLDSLDRALKA